MSKLLNHVIVGLFVMFLYGLGIFGCSDSGSSNSSPNIPSDVDGGMDQFIQDLESIAAHPRPSGSDHHAGVQTMCIDRFEKLGFQVELQVYGSGINIIGTMSGIKSPEERVVVSAHYDSVPGCNAADDNASGVAGLFETARLLSSQEKDRTLVVACLDEEEKNLIGSRAYATYEKERNSNIIISYVYDMIGYIDGAPNSQQIPDNFKLVFPLELQQIENNEYRGDFILLLGDETAMGMLTQIDGLARVENLPLVKLGITSQMVELSLLPDALRADHVPFWEQGYPAVLINDTGEFRNPGYHCGNGPDEAYTLDPVFAMKVITAVTGQISASLNSDE